MYTAAVDTTTVPTSSASTINCMQQETSNLLPPKHVHLGVAAVEVTNPRNGAIVKVYSFHDSGSTMSHLQHSITDRLGLTGIKYVQQCKGFMSLKKLEMESTSILV